MATDKERDGAACITHTYVRTQYYSYTTSRGEGRYVCDGFN